MATAARVTRDNLKSAMAAINRLTNERVLVGYPSETALRKPEPGEKASPLSNAAIAYLMEFGVPEVNIPARPTLIPGMTKMQPEIVRRSKVGLSAVLEGKVVDPQRILVGIGLESVNYVRREFTEGQFIPLSPVTLAKRRKRGRQGTKPLIDTGQLRNAVTYVIRAKGLVHASP